MKKALQTRSKKTAKSTKIGKRSAAPLRYAHPFFTMTPIEPDGELFRLRDGPWNTEWVRFGEVVNGHCMHLRRSGSDLWRVDAA